MKKRWLASAIALWVLLTGCSAPHVQLETELPEDTVQAPEITPSPEIEQEVQMISGSEKLGSVTYRPDVVPSAFADGEKFSQELYSRLVEAIRQGADAADLSGVEATEAQFDGVRAFLLTRNPWGTLNDVVRDADGNAKITYTTADVQERVTKAAEFDDAVTRLLDAAVPEGCSQLSAAISLYKVVAQTVQQDNEAQDCRLYSALVQGLAQDSSFYAESYSFLLDQIGVENAVVFSEDGEYAWNVLTLDGQSYHCDAQTEAGLDGGQALSCFGLSDAQIAEENGWNTWRSENETLLQCSKSLFEAVQQAPYADVDAAGCAVYFSKMEGREGVFRYDLNNGEVLEVQSVLPKQLAVLGENVYFINQDDQMLYRCRTTDGDLRQALENVPVSAIRRVGSELRYVTADDPDQTENVISMD